MQVILTEEEYLKLKRQHDDDRKIYVKRIDVSLALQEMVKEMVADSHNTFDPITLSPLRAQWERIINKFWERIEPT